MLLEAVEQNQVNQPMKEMKTSAGLRGKTNWQGAALETPGGRSDGESKIVRSIGTTYHLPLIRVIEPLQ